MHSGGNSTVVLDNGAGTVKVGFAGKGDPVRVLPNHIVRGKQERKSFVGDQIAQCYEHALVYRRPIERGYVVNWTTQKDVWERAFSKDVLDVTPSNYSLLVTEPHFNLAALQGTMCEIVLEEFGFRSMASTTPAMLSYYGQAVGPGRSCCVVVDSGFSFTHVVPVFDGCKIGPAVRRINVGGKLLTNYLKEIISYRYWNMLDEYRLVNDIKEKLCFVSHDFRGDMERCRNKGPDNTIRREYVLPDSGDVFGHVKQPGPREQDERNGKEQILSLNNERLAVPELLFNPSDIGIMQAGIGETIVEAIEATHPDLHGPLYHNILLTGGNCNLAGFRERVFQEVRERAPDMYDVGVQLADDPVLNAWRAGSHFAAQPEFSRFTVTKAEYFEQGPIVCRRRFFQ